MHYRPGSIRYYQIQGINVESANVQQVEEGSPSRPRYQNDTSRPKPPFAQPVNAIRNSHMAYANRLQMFKNQDPNRKSTHCSKISSWILEFEQST